jgi:hypothetical protein
MEGLLTRPPAPQQHSAGPVVIGIRAR